MVFNQFLGNSTKLLERDLPLVTQYRDDPQTHHILE